MSRSKFLIATLVCFGYVCDAGAQPRIHKGAKELALHVSPDLEGAIGDIIVIDAGWGILLTDRLLARAVFNYDLMEDIAGDDSDYRASELGLAAEYHFRTNRSLVPYTGAGVGWRKTEFGNLDESGITFGPRAGLKLFVADNVSLDFEAAYKLATADVFVNDFEPEDRDLSTMIGFRILF